MPLDSANRRKLELAMSLIGEVLGGGAERPKELNNAQNPANWLPYVGEIRDDKLWADGHWICLSPRGRKLVAYAMGEGRGKSREDVEVYMVLSSQSLKNCVRLTNEAAKAELSELKAKKWPRVVFREGHLDWCWSGPGAKATKTA